MTCDRSPRYFFFLTLLFAFFLQPLFGADVLVGADRLLTSSFAGLLDGKNVVLITNQTGVLQSMERTSDLFVRQHELGTFRLVAFFAPEHGLFGEMYAGEKITNSKYKGIPVYSLHGATRRPTKEMLKNVDVLVYDIQDIGCRSYTFATTLYYCMEEAARYNIKVIVLDRPNPMGGNLVDGPMLDESLRSFVGYINVPYCHGMTIGELARFFNEEYKVQANLFVVPMKGWKRWMRFDDTGLPWIPTSPNIPEATTTLFYPATGVIGELGVVNIGVGYTLPFKTVAAPFIRSGKFVEELNRFPSEGIHFQEIFFKPFSGQMQGKVCQGALLLSDGKKSFLPVQVGYWVLDVLKRLYPDELSKALNQKPPGTSLDMFNKVLGTKKIAEILRKERRPFFALCQVDAEKREEFMKRRRIFLIPSYGE